MGRRQLRDALKPALALSFRFCKVTLHPLFYPRPAFTTRCFSPTCLATKWVDVISNDTGRSMATMQQAFTAPRSRHLIRTATLYKAQHLEVFRMVLLASKEMPEHAVAGKLTVQCWKGASNSPSGARTTSCRQAISNALRVASHMLCGHSKTLLSWSPCCFRAHKTARATYAEPM